VLIRVNRWLIRPELVHRRLWSAISAVNNVRDLPEIDSVSPSESTYSRVIRHGVFVNKSVDMIPLSDFIFLIFCSQFIERTEMDSGSQQIEVAPLKDNPR
jgi:hypothetical protein